MNSRNSLLVALVAGVVGVGVGFVFASVLDGPPAAEASEPAGFVDPSAVPKDDSSAASELLVGGPLETARAPLATPAETPPPRVSEAELERALGAVTVPIIEAARGRGSITGEVLDAAGTPIEGAVIIGTRSSGNPGRDPSDIGAGPPPEQSLEEALRARARSWAARREGRRRAVTGPDGRFEIADLPEDAIYRLQAYLEDHILEAEGSTYSLSPGQHVIFRARQVHVIPVQLVHEDGRPVTKGLIGVRRGSDETFYDWSAEAPDLRLTTGRVGVRGYTETRRSETWYRGGADSTYGSEETSVDVATQAGVPLQLVLKARNGIRGRVIDDFGSGADRPLVRLLPMPAGTELDEDALAGAERYVVPTGDRFHFLDLAPGSYAVGLSGWNEALLAHETVTVGEGVTEVELIVPEPDPKAHLVLHAFGSDGSPLHDLDFRWRYRHRGGSRSGGIQSRRGPDGTWWLKPKQDFFEPWPDGTSYTLTVQHSELGDREIQLEEGQREVTVTFEEPVSIVVIVAGYAGSAYAGKLRIGLSPVVEGEEDGVWRGVWSSRRRNGDGQLSPEGVARFDGLAPGRWKVILQIETERWQNQPVQWAEVHVVSGEKTVTMDLPALFDLTVIAPGLSEKSRLHLRSVRDDGMGSPFGGNSNTTRVDADGRAIFRGLLAGDYVLMGEGIPESVEVTVPCGDVYLDAKEPDCLRVAIGDLEGVMYKAGLRAGDLIIGVDGEEFGSVSNAWKILQGEGEVSLIVQRDGKRLEFSIPRVSPGGDWFARLGGMLTPASRR